MAESSPRRKIAVILATDVVGYSTKMEENEEQTLTHEGKFFVQLAYETGHIWG